MQILQTSQLRKGFLYKAAATIKNLVEKVQ